MCIFYVLVSGLLFLTPGCYVTGEVIEPHRVIYTSHVPHYEPYVVLERRQWHRRYIRRHYIRRHHYRRHLRRHHHNNHYYKKHYYYKQKTNKHKYRGKRKH